ncbi:MAG: ankyrin repeat domain-containing protein [Candidatus Babeliales bacterium]
MKVKHLTYLAILVFLNISSGIFAEVTQKEKQALFDAIVDDNLTKVKSIFEGKTDDEKVALLFAKDPSYPQISLHIAIHGHIRILDFLLKQAQSAKKLADFLKATDYKKKTSLYRAIENGYKNSVEKILEFMQKIKPKDQEYIFKQQNVDWVTSPLEAALESHVSSGIAMLLINFIADIPNEKVKKNIIKEREKHYFLLSTPLSVGAFDLAAKLKKLGADPNQRGKNNNSLLQIHILNSDYLKYHFNKAFPAIEWLLKNGASPNLKNDDGDTSLISAIKSGVSEDKIKKVVELLLTYGADSSIKNKEGKTALDYAKEKNLKQIMNILKKQK